jgi:hypothetical protein
MTSAANLLGVGDGDNQTGAPAGDAPPAPTDWATLFAGEDPAKVKDALGHARSWEARAKENAKAAEELAALRDTTRTAEQKIADERAATSGRLTAAEATAMRYSVALEMGLTKSQAARLIGNTEDELKADAAVLRAEMGTGKSAAEIAAEAEAARRAALVNEGHGRQAGNPPGLNEDSLLEALKGALSIPG